MEEKLNFQEKRNILEMFENFTQETILRDVELSFKKDIVRISITIKSKFYCYYVKSERSFEEIIELLKKGDLITLETKY